MALSKTHRKNSNMNTAPIPNHALNPEAWAAAAMRKAAEWEGEAEASYYVTEARRYLALGNKIKELEGELFQRLVGSQGGI